MEYLRGYRALREDPDWGSKLLTATLLFLSTAFIPIIGQIVLTGFQALILRRAVRGRRAPMPRLDWDFQYLGKLLGVGFKGFVVRFLWTLPLLFVVGALFFCLYFAMVLAVVGMAESGGDEAVPVLLLSCFAIGSLTFIPLTVLLMIPANVAAMRAELTDDINQGLKFKEVIAFSRQHLGVLFKGSLALYLANLGLVLLGILACYVGAFAAASVGLVAHAHFMAQVYQLHVESGGEALPVAPDDVDTPAPGLAPQLPPQGAAPPQAGGWGQPPGA